MIEVRHATAGDMLDFYGRAPPYAVRAWVAEEDGKVLGVAGYHLEAGCAVVFSDRRGGIPRMTIWREAKKMMRRITVPALCVAEDGAGPFLERLGWVFVGNSDAGGVYKWQP